MHKEILDKSQKDLFPLLEIFKDDFGLVGGTALALQIGHRKSIDLDLLSKKEFNNQDIKRIISKNDHEITHTFFDKDGELTVLINDVKVTFLFYPFNIKFEENLNNVIKMADKLTISAMKAYALGRRAKWKDYVDLYYVMTKYHSINEINSKAREIFGKEYNEKLFRSQLSYFEDIDYSEEIFFMDGFEVNDDEIKKELIEHSLSSIL